jgi:hypothetical protein
MAHPLLLTRAEAPLFGCREADLAAYEAEHGAQALAKKLQGVTDEMLGYFAAGNAIVLPLVRWGDVTRQKVADLLVYEIGSFDGMNADPQAASDANVRLRALEAREWGKAVGDPDSDTTDPDLIDSSEDGAVGGSIASTLVMPISDDPVGW